MAIDSINHPAHYNSAMGIECIEAMRLIWGDEKVETFCMLNAFKYRWRAGRKGDGRATEDIKKALWYEDKATELMINRVMGGAKDEN